MGNITFLRNVVELNTHDVFLCVAPSVPRTSWQIHAIVRDAFQSRQWLFDFTHQDVARILTQLGYRRKIESKTIIQDGKKAKMYWR